MDEETKSNTETLSPGVAGSSQKTSRPELSLAEEASTIDAKRHVEATRIWDQGIGAVKGLLNDFYFLHAENMKLTNELVEWATRWKNMQNKLNALIARLRPSDTINRE